MDNHDEVTKEQRIANMIKRNVDLWYADVISHERFSKRQSVLWFMAAAPGVDGDYVLDIVCNRKAGHS